VERSILAWEVCFSLQPESKLREQLRALVVESSAGMSLHGKWKMYRQLTDVLTPNMEVAVRGCWDFFDDDTRAVNDFDMWSKGMITREGVRAGPQTTDAYRGEERFLTFTMAFLLMQGTPAERSLKERCAVPSNQLWQRRTFEKILLGVPALNFASVIADVSYVLPGREDTWALTRADLTDPKFAYLRKIE
jgi:hypothetical protein